MMPHKTLCGIYAQRLLTAALLLLLVIDVLLHQLLKVLETNGLQHHGVIEPAGARGAASAGQHIHNYAAAWCALDGLASARETPRLCKLPHGIPGPSALG